MEDLAFFLLADAQISAIITARLKADLKKTQNNLITILLLPYSPWNLDLRPLLTQTLEGKNTTVLYKDALGLVVTTWATTSSSRRPHDIHRRVTWGTYQVGNCKRTQVIYFCYRHYMGHLASHLPCFPHLQKNPTISLPKKGEITLLREHFEIFTLNIK